MTGAVAVTLEEITAENREAVLALRIVPGQDRFVSSVRDSLAEAAEYPHARPWYRAVFASGEPAGPVGFVMVSWNCEPQPPEIIGPWFLWKLLIDERYQGRGYGAAVVRQPGQFAAGPSVAPGHAGQRKPAELGRGQPEPHDDLACVIELAGRHETESLVEPGGPAVLRYVAGQ